MQIQYNVRHDRGNLIRRFRCTDPNTSSRTRDDYHFLVLTLSLTLASTSPGAFVWYSATNEGPRVRRRPLFRVPVYDVYKKIVLGIVYYLRTRPPTVHIAVLYR